MNFLNTRRQGDAGVGATIAYYSSLGCPIMLPLGESQRYDMVVDTGPSLERVQCKTTTYRGPAGTFRAELRTKGGNKSSSYHNVQKLDKEAADVVTVLDAEGRLWLYTASELHGQGTITLCEKEASQRVVLYLSNVAANG